MGVWNDLGKVREMKWSRRLFLKTVNENIYVVILIKSVKVILEKLKVIKCSILCSLLSEKSSYHLDVTSKEVA